MILFILYAFGHRNRLSAVDKVLDDIFSFFSEGDEQREVDQNKARVLKIFEHIGEALPQLAISLTFLFNEGTYHHPLTVLSAIVSLISLMMGLVTGTLALKKRGLRL